jgi:monothiol glutaredoxin
MATKIPLPIVNPEYQEPSSSPAAPEEAAPATSSGLRSRAEGGDIFEEIRKEISENRIMLYMKGSPRMPRCGFSARVAELLMHSGVTELGYSDILLDPEKRQGIKDFSDWPTIPQLYVDGEFVGGCDIVIDMYQSGELQELVAPKS